MARGAAVTVENNFTRGLVTEFTAMNFPENAVTEADNVVFSELGRVTRREGLNAELDWVPHDVNTLLEGTGIQGDEAFVEFKWPSVGSSGSVTFLVQQVGSFLRFFSSTEGGSLSSNLMPFYLDLMVRAVGGAPRTTVGRTPCQFTYGNGRLFVAHPNCEPFYVEYNSGSNTISTSNITIEVRDMEGVNDGLANDTRPVSLTNLHRYNLFNQGWYATAAVFTIGQEIPQFINVLQGWDNQRNDFPSNSDIWWVYKGSTEEAHFASNVTDASRNLGMVGPDQFALGNTPAPKGHYIYNAFNINRTAMTGIGGLPSKTAGAARPSVIAWYAGRVWYSGVSADGYSGTLYFSQLAEGPRQFGKCHQINDPTSETVFDLIDTDGGTIDLPLLDRVVAMKVLGDVLVVVGSNGVYTIRGSDNGPFRATNYTVSFVSSVGASSALSLVEAEGAILWINTNGIYAVGPDEAGLSFNVSNISKQTIQRVVAGIPSDNVPFVKGAYNPREQVLRWIYSDDADLTGFKYNRILDFNVVSRAFYTHTVPVTPSIVGLVSLTGQGSVVGLETVVDEGGLDVTTNSLVAVTVEQETAAPAREVFKFTILGVMNEVQEGLTYGGLSDQGNLDYRAFFLDIPYSSYFVSGYRIRGEMLRPFNSTPVSFVVRNIEDGGLLVSGVWDYGFRQSSSQQLYLVRPEVEYIIRRVKIRGKGKSLQLRFESVEDRPFEIVGWSTFDTGGQLP